MVKHGELELIGMIIKGRQNSNEMDKIIFWDFHGTLDYNDWMFSKALLGRN